VRIALYGLGNVGLVAALCLCEQGHEVVGIELNESKVSQLRSGKSYIQESGINELLSKHKDRFSVQNSGMGLKDIDCFIICVGTPPMSAGEVNLDQIIATFHEITEVLKNNSGSTIILRSTVPPGTVDNVVFPILNKTSLSFKFIYHPEFQREGNAIEDFLHPHIHVLGLTDIESPVPCMELFQNSTKLIKVPVRSAEMLKYLNNSYHALKVAFANEISSLAHAMGAEVPELFEAFFADTKLNISTSYLKPGFSFGGPCLTKELSALEFLGRKYRVQMPLLAATTESNTAHFRRMLTVIEKEKPKYIVFFGVSFKHGTDDLRSSPALELANSLNQRPSYLPMREIWIHDHSLVMERLAGDSFKTFSDVPNIVPDVIVLGSHLITADQVEWIKKCGCKIFDLELSKSSKLLPGLTTIKPYEVT